VILVYVIKSLYSKEDDEEEDDEEEL
jgi:hypothetical protein